MLIRETPTFCIFCSNFFKSKISLKIKSIIKNRDFMVYFFSPNSVIYLAHPFWNEIGWLWVVNLWAASKIEMNYMWHYFRTHAVGSEEIKLGQRPY